MLNRLVANKMSRHIAMWMVAVGACAFPLAAQDLPSAESLLDKFVEVTGGKQAYTARTSEVMHGTIEYAAMGLRGKLTRWTAEPGFYREKMEMPQIGAMEMGVRDGVAWERTDLLGPRIKSGTERAEALREAKMNSNALWRDLYKEVKTTGEEVVEGEPCYIVVMTPETGSPETLYLSKASGLAVKMSITASTQMGELAAEILFREYKNFGGILTPSRVTERTFGQEITITIESVEANPEIPPGMFDLPPDVAALVDSDIV